jgi:hypothetical protein
MTQSLAELRASVAAQRERIPMIYGDVNFDVTPERFCDDIAVRSCLETRGGSDRRSVLADQALLERMRAYTMLGDLVADAYAALAPKFGFRRLIQMLVDACDSGLAGIPEAPPELAAFIGDMEQVPDWIDMSLVEAGAKSSRNAVAHASPFLIRGAFFATFLNEYAALPMALTGQLSNQTAARRIFETATFFAVMTLPGAVKRNGAGFKAAAMVRLMHALVRFNMMTRPMAHSMTWDVRKYGIPIPLVDQMPAGLIAANLAARRAVSSGRKQFTHEERARVEFARYQCFLLGLPRELLGTTPEELVHLSAMRAATLRDAYNDATCGALMRATMRAQLFDDSLMGKVCKLLEPSFAKLFCTGNFLSKDPQRAVQIGIAPKPLDYVLAGIATVLMAAQIAAYAIALRLPWLGQRADQSLVAKINRLLTHYGHADFTTDADVYRPAPAAGTHRT